MASFLSVYHPGGQAGVTPAYLLWLSDVGNTPGPLIKLSITYHLTPAPPRPRPMAPALSDRLALHPCSFLDYDRLLRPIVAPGWSCLSGLHSPFHFLSFPTLVGGRQSPGVHPGAIYVKLSEVFC